MSVVATQPCWPPCIEQVVDVDASGIRIPLSPEILLEVPLSPRGAAVALAAAAQALLSPAASLSLERVRQRLPLLRHPPALFLIRSNPASK